MKGGAASALRMAFAYTIQADFEVSSTETSQRSWALGRVSQKRGRRAHLPNRRLRTAFPTDEGRSKRAATFYVRTLLRHTDFASSGATHCNDSLPSIFQQTENARLAIVRPFQL